ncbi:MAG: PAS domain S-box protein [Acidobacteriota bacterium]
MKLGLKLSITFVVALVIIGVVGIRSFLGIQELVDKDRLVGRTQVMLQSLDHILSVLKDAETGQRGFILTGEEPYLKPYNSATAEVQQDVDLLSSLAPDSLDQQQSLRRLQRLTRDELDELQETIKLRRAGGEQAALVGIRTGRGERIMDDIRELIAEMETRERQLLDARSLAAAQVARQSTWTVAIGVLLSLAVLTIAALIATRTMRIAVQRARPGDAARSWPKIVFRYAFAVAAVALAVLLRWWLIQKFGPMPLFITFYPAVLVVASVGGGGPGIVATILSALASDYWFILPAGFGIAAANDAIALGLYTGTCLFLSVLAERHHRARWAEAVSATRERELALLDMGNLVALDLDHRIIRWSQGSQRLYGYDAQEAQGRFTHDLLDTHFQQPREQIQQALLQRGYWEGQVTRRAKDGSELVIVILWALRRDERGRPSAILEVSTDITAQERAEEILRRERQWLQVTLNSIGDAVLATDTAGKITFLNPVGEKLTGWQEAEASGQPVKTVFQIINEKTREPGEDIVSRVLGEGHAVALANHTALVTRDGHEVPIEDSAAPIKDGAGKVIGVVLVFHDVTEKRRVQEALSESEERFRRLVKQAPIPLSFVNRSEELLYLNDRFIQVFGYTSDHVPTLKEWWQLAYPDEQYRRWAVDTWQTAVRRAAETNTDIEPTEYKVTCKDGTVRQMVISGITIEDNVLATFIDVTERRRAEDDLQRLVDELRRSNQELEQFAYVTSHDLQEPLRQVRSFTQLLRERYSDKLEEKAAEYMQFIVEGAGRMSDLVRDLLKYSRVGTHEARHYPTSCQAALKRALANLEMSIAEAKAQLTQDELPTVLAEPTQLAQLFQNLIGNAIKFRREGVTPVIHVGSRRDGPNWLFWVKDNGIGIDPIYYQKVFQIFQRLHSRARYAGTGIGLAICKRIVEQHRGRIWIDSEAGKGATVYFTLPQEGVESAN